MSANMLSTAILRTVDTMIRDPKPMPGDPTWFFYRGNKRREKVGLSGNVCAQLALAGKIHLVGHDENGNEIYRPNSKCGKC